MTGYRRIVIVGCVMLCYSILAFAQTTQAQDKNALAKTFAQSWFEEQRSPLKASTQLNEDIHVDKVESKSGALYLAEGSTKGFLLFFIVDNQPEIIGYSLTSTFPKDPTHPLFTEWLPNTKPQSHKPTNTPSHQATGLKSMQDLSVEPLIVTKWGQGIPYNQFCPQDQNGVHAPVGCVAVAMAQIMNMWQWPDRGLGSNAYTPTNYPPYGEQFANFDTLYQWQSMLPLQATEASAYLLYHAGVASYMNYGPNESGANTAVYAPSALIENFKYYRGIQVREKEKYSEKDWFKMLRQELINGRPLIYFGANPDGGTGHAFNIDGFHSESYFHFNWGWNGAGNGYYRLENMAAGGGNFTKGQAAVFWIQPDHLEMHDRPGQIQTLPGDQYVQLIWDDLTINDLSHYNIFRDGIQVGTSISNSFKDEGLINGQTYRYQISASYIGNAEGDSDLTDEILAKPIDDLQLDYVNGFEVNPESWEFKNDIQGFRWGPASEMGIPGNDGHVMAIRSDLSEPGVQVMDYMTAPGLDIRGINHVAISFDYMFKQKPGVDYLFLMYRRYDNGLWYPLAMLDSTGDWSDWKTVYYYFPEEAKYFPIQLGFYYNDFRGQGFGAAIDNIRIWTIDQPPTPEFSIKEDTICQHEVMTYSSESSGNIYSWHWDFGDGAVPRYADTEGPHEVYYESYGAKSVSLLLNHLDPKHKSNYLKVIPQPIAGFEVANNGILAFFTDTSQHADYYWWDFGDGHTSTLQNPENKYHEHKIFEITQIVYNDHCLPDTMKMELDFRINTAVEDLKTETNFKIYPNPSSGIFNLEISDNSPGISEIRIFNIRGQTVHQENLNFQSFHMLDIRKLRPGIYFLTLNSGNKLYQKKLIIE